MDDPIDVKHAASMLGVSARRVRQLIDEGLLEGQLIGGRYLLDRRQVRNRGRHASSSGRPLSAQHVWGLAAAAEHGWVRLLQNPRRVLDAIERGAPGPSGQVHDVLADLDPNRVLHDRELRARIRQVLDEIDAVEGPDALQELGSLLRELPESRRHEHVDGADRWARAFPEYDADRLEDALRSRRGALAYRHRGEARPHHAHPGLLHGLREDPRVVLSGPDAAQFHGFDLVPGDRIDGYVHPDNADLVVHEHGLREVGSAPQQAEANVALRIADGWRELDPRAALPHFAPRLIAAWDLLERPATRERTTGQRMLALIQAAHGAGDLLDPT